MQATGIEQYQNIHQQHYYYKKRKNLWQTGGVICHDSNLVDRTHGALHELHASMSAHGQRDTEKGPAVKTRNKGTKHTKHTKRLYESTTNPRPPQTLQAKLSRQRSYEKESGSSHSPLDVHICHIRGTTCACVLKRQEFHRFKQGHETAHAAEIAPPANQRCPCKPRTRLTRHHSREPSRRIIY